MARTEQSRPPTLTDQIQELESLIAEQADSDKPADSRVPVLDDPIDPAAPDPGASAPLQPGAPDLERLERRIHEELEDLAGIIRTVIRRCIDEELRSDTKPPAGEATDDPDGDTTGDR